MDLMQWTNTTKHLKCLWIWCVILCNIENWWFLNDVDKGMSGCHQPWEFRQGEEKSEKPKEQGAGQGTDDDWVLQWLKYPAW